MGDGFHLSSSAWPALAEPARIEGERGPWRSRVSTFLHRIWGSLPFCIFLLVLTLLTTLVVGVHLAENYAQHLPVFDLDISWAFFAGILHHPQALWAGAPYAITLVGILLAHELGHYFTCRHYHIDATYPLFVPAPTLIGTFGAFIRIKSPLVTRQELFDVGISGPIAGFVVAVPALILAAWHSGARLWPMRPGTITLGHPLALTLLARVFHHGIQPSHVTLTPIGCGVWVGLFATALNLLPMGQLDGGHILYAVLGRKHRYISMGFFAALIPLGIFCWMGWILWAVLMLFLGLRHPAPLIDSKPLDRRRKNVALLALAMFILCFTFTPFAVT